MNLEGGAHRARIGSRTGMILPVALLLILALTAVAMSLIALAHTELLLDRGGTAYLENRIRNEAALHGESTSGEVPREQPLSGGFVLLVAPASGPGPAAVRWRPDPDSIARGFPGAAEVGTGSTDAPEGRVEPLEGCTSPVRYPLVRSRLEPGGPPPDPSLPDPPRVGILDVDRLIDLPGVDLAGEDSFPNDSGGELFRAPDGARIEQGAGVGVLVSKGALELGGTARFTGLVMITGDLVLEGSARIDGVALVGGGLELDGEVRIRGCPQAAAEAFVEALPAGSHPVVAGEHLGRF